MSLQEKVYSVLVVSSSDKFLASVSPLLPEASFSPVDRADSVSKAKRRLVDKSYEILLINSPLPDEDGCKLAIDFCGVSNGVALLFVSRELYHEFYDKTVDFGVMTVPTPTSVQVVSQSLDYTRAVIERLKRFNRTVTTVQEKMKEIRIVNRAKWVLINELKMTEEDAHRYIEKQAMDRCISKATVAQNIINTYK